jgi:NAD(P)-dependent dehydrogenase (short-subunit alcohol dehydrogenase family)
MGSTVESTGRVFIGGISGGIGAALARRLLLSGYRVGGAARPSEKLNAFINEYPEIEIYEADMTQSAAAAKAVEAFVASAGGIDAYVHAVGSIFLKPLHLTKDEEWAEVLATNLTSAFYGCRAAVTQMRRQKSGSIVLFSSVAAQIGLGNHEAIAAAKGGVESLVRALAATNASLGIRVNAIAPGLVDTPAAKMMTANEAVRQFSERMHPLGRIGNADEIAALAEWLISKDATWVTGQIISQDGGMGSILPKPRG